MKNRIIEIVELGLPKSLIQRENEPTTELIETNLLVEELNKALCIYDVVSRRALLLDFAEYSENDKTSTAIDECVDNYLYSIKQ